MGSATIQSGGESGKYSILYHINKTRMQARITKLGENIERAETVELPVLETILDTVEAEIATFTAALQAAIAAKDEAEMRKQTSYMNTSKIHLESAQSEASGKKAEIISLKAEKALLEKNLPVDQVMDAWCADFNEQITGEVGTVEIAGERSRPIIIRPAGDFGTGAHNNPAVDGEISPGRGLSPEESFYNQAMLPGHQRWNPVYRLATITAIDNLYGTCEIVLDATFSSQKDEGSVPFDVNQTETYGSSPIYENVPISYMKCNSYAFGVGDRVLVKFERNPLNPADPLDYRPKVIGFESHPRECKCQVFYTFDFEFNIARPYSVSLDGVGIEYKESSLACSFFTPPTQTKVHNAHTYVLHASQSNPKIVIDGIEYTLPSIPNVILNGNTTPEYDVKRFEIVSNGIHIHDYKYFVDLGLGNRLSLGVPAYGRIQKYSLGMVLQSTEMVELPSYFRSGYVSDKLIYIVQGGTEKKVYIYNLEFQYIGMSNVNFTPAITQSITGWLDEKLLLVGYLEGTTGQAFVTCLDMNFNQLWQTGLGGLSVHTITTNGEHVFIGANAPYPEIGYIYSLDINTGAVVSTYTLPTILNDQLPQSYGTVYTRYCANRMAAVGNKLYVGLRLWNIWAPMEHPRVYIFNVSGGGLTLEQEGFPIKLRTWEHQQSGIQYTYYSLVEPLCLSACKYGWWMGMRLSDAYVDIFGNADEPGGLYIFEPENLVPLGRMNQFDMRSSTVF